MSIKIPTGVAYLVPSGVAFEHATIDLGEWGADDIGNALKSVGVDPTEENIAKVMQQYSDEFIRRVNNSAWRILQDIGGKMIAFEFSCYQTWRSEEPVCPELAELIDDETLDIIVKRMAFRHKDVNLNLNIGFNYSCPTEWSFDEDGHLVVKISWYILDHEDVHYQRREIDCRIPSIADIADVLPDYEFSSAECLLNIKTSEGLVPIPMGLVTMSIDYEKDKIVDVGCSEGDKHLLQFEN